jgi:hypothetical protein
MKGNFNHFAPSGGGYRPSRGKFTEDEFNFLKAYLNGSHDNNYQRSPGAPNTSGFQTVVKHYVASGIIKPNAAETAISLAITGIPEAPIIVASTVSSVATTMQYNNLPTVPSTGPVGWQADYLKSHGVGSYRCVSLSCKIVDETPPMYRKGTILVARNPSGFDDNPLDIPTADVSYAATHRAYLRSYDSLPQVDADILSLSNTAYVGPTEDGTYFTLPALNPEFEFMDRKDEHSKAVFSAGTTATNINIVQQIGNPLAVKVGLAAALGLVTGINGAGLGNQTYPATGSNYDVASIIPVHPSTMCSASVLINGLDNENSVLRVSVVSSWEYIVGFNSDWTEASHQPMNTNLKVLQAASMTFASMPDAYPAAANFWNEIWDKFKGIYRDLEPTIQKVVSSLPPEYAAPAHSVKTFVDKLTDTNKKTEKKVDKLIADVGKMSAKVDPKAAQGNRQSMPHRGA